MEQKENIKTKQSEEQIELRSSNTQRFIGEEPPFLVRYGTMIIVLFLMLVAAIWYFHKYILLLY